jgi:hypothetical protein
MEQLPKEIDRRINDEAKTIQTAQGNKVTANVQCGYILGAAAEAKKALKVVRILNSLMLSVMAHPDYTGEENEEWTDLVETGEEVLSEYLNKQK